MRQSYLGGIQNQSNVLVRNLKKCNNPSIHCIALSCLKGTGMKVSHNTICRAVITAYNNLQQLLRKIMIVFPLMLIQLKLPVVSMEFTQSNKFTTGVENIRLQVTKTLVTALNQILLIGLIEDLSRNSVNISDFLDMINAISAADIAFIMSSSTSAWLLSPLECSPQKQNG